MILVTGGTGLVGSHLLYQLVKDNQHIRATYRRQHKLNAVKHVFSYYTEDANALFDAIDWVEADITNIPQLEDAFKGITHVYHCAAFISFEPDKYRTLRKINIEGTANIVNLCISHNVQKLCYVSSIAALGDTPTTNPSMRITETAAWNSDADLNVYAITKYGAELEVWRGTQEGVDAVVVNPGIIVGPGFWHGGGSGGIFKKIYNGLNYYIEGGSGYVDVYDVVNTMQQLMDSPIKNEGYIVIAENISFKTFNETVAQYLNVAAAKQLLKSWHLQLLWRLDWLSHKLFGKRRTLSKQLAKTLTKTSQYNNSKVKTALDFEFTPVEVSVKNVATFFLQDIESA